MKLHELKPNEGSRNSRRRVGRGPSSGWGHTSGSGEGGQKKRSGGNTRLGFEGGQTPLFQTLPKRGFTNIHRKEYAIINLSTLNKLDEGTDVTPELLAEKGIIKNPEAAFKVLGEGSLDKKLSVKANKFSKSAKEAIEAAGGSVEEI